MVLNSVPTANGPTWNVVLGQTTATGAVTGTTATTLATPQGVWTDGTRILVADSANNRVLIWNTIPTANGTAADLVLGQASFTVKLAPSPPTPSSMNNPVDVFFDGARLYVSNSRTNRIMGWNGMPTANNQPADFFVGQASGSTGTANAGAGTQEPNAIGLSIPGEITVARGSLYITDMVNSPSSEGKPTVSPPATARVTHERARVSNPNTSAPQTALCTKPRRELVMTVSCAKIEWPPAASADLNVTREPLRASNVRRMIAFAVGTASASPAPRRRPPHFANSSRAAASGTIYPGRCRCLSGPSISIE